jgi:hypothetical protein
MVDILAINQENLPEFVADYEIIQRRVESLRKLKEGFNFTRNIIVCYLYY